MSNNEILTDIRERLVRVETILNNQADLRNITEKAVRDASKALASANVAHTRIDKIDRVIFWVVTTIVGTFIVGAINYFMG